MEIKKELILAVMELQNGNEEAFRLVYDETQAYVYSRAKCIFSDEQDVADLVQEVYVAVYKNIATLETPESIFAWLRTITFYQSTKLLKKKGKDILLTEENQFLFDELVGKEKSAEECSIEEQDVKIIKDCINKLSDDQKLVIFAFYYDEMKVEEIASLLGISEGTVKSRLFLARKNLKRVIEDEEKNQGYKLHSFSGFTILFVLQSMMKENTSISLGIKKRNFKNICREIESNIKSTWGTEVLAKTAMGIKMKVATTTIGIMFSLAVIAGAGSIINSMKSEIQNGNGHSEGDSIQTECLQTEIEIFESEQEESEGATERETEIINVSTEPETENVNVIIEPDTEDVNESVQEISSVEESVRDEFVDVGEGLLVIYNTEEVLCYEAPDKNSNVIEVKPAYSECGYEAYNPATGWYRVTRVHDKGNGDRTETVIYFCVDSYLTTQEYRELLNQGVPRAYYSLNCVASAERYCSLRERDPQDISIIIISNDTYGIACVHINGKHNFVSLEVADECSKRQSEASMEWDDNHEIYGIDNHDGTVSVNFRGAYWTQECSLEEFYLLYEGAVLFESYKECIYQQELYELEAVQAVLGD